MAPSNAAGVGTGEVAGAVGGTQGQAKHLAIISVIPGSILFLVSALLMKDVTVISSDLDPHDAAHEVDPYERMAWISLAEFGLFIGATQTLFSGIYWYLARRACSSHERARATAFETYELIWVALNVVWIFGLLTCFAFCFGWRLQLVERRGTAFVVFLGIDFAATVAVLCAWFDFKPEEQQIPEN